LLLVLLAVIPAFGLIGYSAWDDRADAVAQTEQETGRLASFVAETQSRHIEDTRRMLNLLASLPLARDPALLHLCNDTLPRIRDRNPMYANIGMTDADGNLLCSARPFKQPVNFSDRAWFRRAVATRNFAVGDYLVGQLTNMPSIGLAYPMYGENGKLQRVLYATIDLAWFEALAAKLPLSSGSVVTVADAQGIVLARHPDPRHEWMGKPTRHKEALEAIVSSGCIGFMELRGQDGVLRLNTIRPLLRVNGRCVYVRVGVPKDEVFSSIERHFQRDMAAMLTVTLLVFILAWFGSGWIVLRPVRALSRAAHRLGEGDLSTRTGLPYAQNELGQLAKSFDEMAAGMQERESCLLEADRKLARANRALTVLSAGNRAMLRAGNEQTLLDDICRMIVDKGGYPMAWVGYREENGSKAIHLMAHSGFEVSRLDPRCLTWDAQASGISATGAAMRSGRTELFRADANTEPPSCMVESGCAAALALPLSDDRSLFGVLSIYAVEADAFDEREIELLSEAAADLAFGIARLRDQARRKEAEEANRIKTEFLANMSHELRTPLNAIIGFSEVLKDGLMGEMTAEQREYVTDIFTSGRHLLSLINDILDLSKVEAGKMTLDLERTNVATLLENSLSVVREKAAAHRIELTQEIQQNLKPLQVDPRKTKQIVYNLLSNAVKFTPEGGRVTLRARRVTRREVTDWNTERSNSMRLPLSASGFAEFLEIAVEDSGIGIKREDVPRLFQPFSQLDSSLSRRYEGTGLGLAMVMKMAELHDGTVAVGSEPDKGSCFTVWLPWREAGVAAPSAALAEVPSGCAKPLALVIEDNDAAAELVRLQLKAEGLEALRVASAEEALKLRASLHPSVVVLDIFLPGMDGWDCLACIKQSGSPWADVPVVIASIATDSGKGFALGASEVLQKPVGREDIAAALQRLGLRPREHRECKVLLVDDDPKAVELMSAYFSEPGYQVLRAYGGREGIEMAQRELPDLMMLDLMMPEVSGFDVVEALKAKPETATIPIMVVTAKQLTPEDHAVLNGYVSAILEKATFDHDRFAAEIRRALTMRGRNKV